MISAVSKLLGFSFLDDRTNTVCDTVEPLSAPFEATRYMGTWYEIQHTGGVAF